MSNENRVEDKELLPCPFCGNDFPFTYVTAFSAILECECGAGIKGSEVRTVYKLDELPEGLRDKARPAELLIVRTKECDKHWPEHGYYGVSIVESFFHYGHAQKWNRRVAK